MRDKSCYLFPGLINLDLPVTIIGIRTQKYFNVSYRDYRFVQYYEGYISVIVNEYKFLQFSQNRRVTSCLDTDVIV